MAASSGMLAFGWGWGEGGGSGGGGDGGGGEFEGIYEMRRLSA